MAFRFSLASVLRLRESIEKAELQRLQAIAAQLMQVRVEIELADDEIEAAKRQVIEQASAGISGAELQLAAIGESARRAYRAALVAKRDELERLRNEQQARYIEARRRREILANLRLRQLSAYEREQARREQQRIDDLFLMRRTAKKRIEPSQP